MSKQEGWDTFGFEEAIMSPTPLHHVHDADLTRLVDSAADGLLCVAENGLVLYANVAARRLLGLAKNPAGDSVEHLGAPTLVERITTALKPKARCRPGPANVTVGDRTLSVHMWHARSGPRNLAVSIRDESAVVSRHQRVEAVLDATTDGLIVLSPTSEVSFANPAAAQMLGTTTRKLSGKPLAEPELAWIDGEDGDGTETERELEIDRDGTHRVVKVRVSPIMDSGGGATGEVVALRDITAEHEIAQMKNEFVSTVSHELRTPLTSIKGYVDLILDGDAGEINDIQREFLSIVKENSDRLVDLINDMLDISRIESGRIHLKIEPHDIVDLVEGAVDTFRAVLAQSGRDVDVQLPDELLLVAADRDRVRQVLINLLSNALKYSPAGGSVTVSASGSKDRVTISVRDHGLGISKQDQKMLFTKFYRVDSAMTREIGGTGLGLSICKNIIELLGGEIGVKSTVGEGSTFWFSLPLAPYEMVRLPEVSGPAGSKGTVLVVDSDPEIATLIETYLMRRGYSVYKAYDSAEAIATAKRVKPHVITLDVILEGDDGFELIQRFKELPETANTPVVVLSIICDEGRSCRYGAANYLEKPINQTRLFEVVGNLVGSTESPLVLVVDDDRSVVAMLSETLRRKGYSVAAAYDGAEALVAIEKLRPHAVLLDLRMPKMDGFEVIRRVKTHAEWGDIPIVVMTAYAIESANTELLAHVAGRVNKPLSPDDIASQVEQLLAGFDVGGQR